MAKPKDKLQVHVQTTPVTEVGAIWQSAIEEYERTTSVKIANLSRAESITDILAEVQLQKSAFDQHRHDGGKLDKFRSLLRRSLDRIEPLSNVVAPAVSTAFPPSSAIFAAVVFLLQTAKSMSADYDKIEAFFEDLEVYLTQLKILEGLITPVPSLEQAIIQVLRAVLVLCGMCSKHVKKRRIVKAFKNLVSGVDEDLAEAYDYFHKMIHQQEGIINNATFEGVRRLQGESIIIKKDVQENLNIASRTEKDIQFLVTNATKLQISLDDQATAAERSELSAKLSSLDFDETHRDILKKHHAGTGQWLLQDTRFDQWHSLNQASVLWCPGIPGAGKTVMTAVVADFVQRTASSQSVAIVNIYCDYKNSKTHDDLQIVSCIARQLFNQIDHIPDIVREFCKQKATRKRNPTGDEWISLIRSLTGFFTKTYVFIDALDECPETSREDLLGSLAKLETAIQLFVTSRLHIDLTTRFRDMLRIDILADPNDLQVYLEHQMVRNHRMAVFIKKDSKLKRDIINLINTKACGMFLLACLQMDYLCRQTNIRAVRTAMNNLPKELSEFYASALNRIENQAEEDRHLAIKALSYIFCAKRPLTVFELLHVLAIEDEDSDVDELALPEMEFLLNASAGLIGTDSESETVRLVHFTLQEYLEKQPESLLQDTELILAKECLKYLSFEEFLLGPCQSALDFETRMQKYQFAEYAAFHCGKHAMEYQTDTNLSDMVLDFLNDDNRLTSFVQILYGMPFGINKSWDSYPANFRPLHVAAYWGLEQIIQILLNDGADVHVEDSRGLTALQLAAKWGNPITLQFLIDNDATINASNKLGETALAWASRNGHTECAKILLDNKAHVLAKDTEGWHALDWAVQEGNHELVKLQLSYGIDISTDTDGKQKALNLAAEEGHELTVKMIVDSGADIDARDDSLSTALDWAAAAGQFKPVETLLQQGASARCKDIYDNTALHWCTPYEEMVALMLKHDPEIDAKNNLGQTPLSWAAQDCPVRVAELLIDGGADIHTRDKWGLTPLHRAAIRGRDDMIQLLLDKGADPSIQDGFGWTPLQVAMIKQHNHLIHVLSTLMVKDEDFEAWEKSLQCERQQLIWEEAVEYIAMVNTSVTNLRLALRYRHFGRMQSQIDKGHDVDGRDIAGWTALINATESGDVEAVQLLLANKANPDICGFNNRNALHWSCEHGMEELTNMLLDQGADLEMSAFSWTPGLLAAKMGQSRILHILIDRGMNVLAQDYHGQTVLHWITMHGDTEIMVKLLQHGADIDVQDCWGRTPLMWAIEHQQPAATQILLEHRANVETMAKCDVTALCLAAFMKDMATVNKLKDRGATSTPPMFRIEYYDEKKDTLEATGPMFRDLLKSINAGELHSIELNPLDQLVTAVGSLPGNDAEQPQKEEMENWLLIPTSTQVAV